MSVSRKSGRAMKLAVALGKRQEPESKLVGEVVRAFVEDGARLDGGLAALAVRAVGGGADPGAARRGLLGVLRSCAKAVRVADSRDDALRRARFLLTAMDSALVARRDEDPSLASLVALLFGDRLIRAGRRDRDANETWARWAYRLQVPDDELEGVAPTPPWPRSGVDAPAVAFPIANRRDRLCDLGLSIASGNRTPVAKAAAVRRFWQLSRVPW